MSATDRRIEEVLAKFGEPMAGNVWRVQGTPVIYHKALERIAAQAKITFDAPTVYRSERDEAVMLVVGRMGERMEWSIGEALVGVNYRVSGKQAAYVWAMAEKRAKDRVILKLIELHGFVYSEEEADEFKEGRPEPEQQAPQQEDKRHKPQSPADKLIRQLKLATCTSHLNELAGAAEFKLELAKLPPEDKARVIRAGTDRRNELAEAA